MDKIAYLEVAPESTKCPAVTLALSRVGVVGVGGVALVDAVVGEVHEPIAKSRRLVAVLHCRHNNRETLYRLLQPATA